MCRTAGRRCPCNTDPVRRLIGVARQRLSRYARAVDNAGDEKTRERNERLFENALADVEERTGTKLTPTPAPPSPTRAAEFTYERTRNWSDDQLATALSECWDDQQACDAIAATMDRRDRQDRAWDQAYQATRNRYEDPDHDAWSQLAAEQANTNPIDKPGNRPKRRLTADQQARADYETMREVWYLDAEHACNGVLLSPEGRAAGIDARSLWAGPVHVAAKYASPELKGWWQANGRITWGAFRGQALGRSSDRGQVETVRAGKAWADAVSA